MTDICPNCRQPVRVGAKFCAKCGHSLATMAQPAIPAANQSGAAQQASASPPAVTATPAASPRQRDNRLWRIFALGALIYLVAATGILLIEHTVAATAPTPAPPQAAPNKMPREAGQAGLDWLLDSAVAWQRSNRCNGCHVQSFAIMGAAAAYANDYAVDLDKTRELIDYLESIQDGSGYITARRGNVGAVVQTVLAGIGVSEYDAAVGQEYGELLVRMADWLISQQSGDGSWPVDHREPPVDQGQAMTTGGAIMTLVAAQRHDARHAYAQAIQAGAEWLRSAAPDTTQDIAFAIIGLLASGAASSDSAVQERLTLLHDRQNGDGGWGETTGRGSNGYATGQALYAFQKAGVPIREESFRNGVLWLLENQEAGGWWRQVNSQQTSSGRASNYATTMWSVIGLGEIFDIATENEFRSLIHPDQRETGSPAWWALAIFLLLPALLVAGVWQRRRSERRGDRRERRQGKTREARNDSQ